LSPDIASKYHISEFYMVAELFVTFHGIGAPPDHVPAEERPYWMSETHFRKFIAGVQEAASNADIRIVATFDDGNRSDIDIAAPILVDHGLRGIFFPCSGRIGRQGYLTADDIRALNAEGFEIGSHGVDHVPWRGLDADALIHEVAESKAAVEEVIGRDITSAALPFGAYDAATLWALRENGYRTVYSSDPGISPTGAWFRRRWSYHSDRQFDIRVMAYCSRSLSHRIVSGAKRIFKSLR
jgi:peptidoglycan/xylan/chitin deacetylase (PgdA/CDA1 family)